LLALLAFAVVASPLGQALLSQANAQQADPVVVVSVAGSDELLSDILYLTETAGVGDFGRLMALMASPYTATLNKQRPAGAYLTMQGQGPPTSVSFLPVKNLDTLLANLEPQIGEAEDAGNGVLEVATDRPQSLFLKEADGWVFVSNDKANLAVLPENPVQILGGLNEKYTVAVQVDFAGIPAEMRAMATEQIRRGFEQRLDEEMDDDSAAAMRELGPQAVEAVVQLIDEADKLTLGWEVDAEEKTTYLDLEFTALEGTQLAAQMSLIKDSNSAFSGFVLPEAALTFHTHGTGTEAEVQQALMLIDRVRTQAMKGIEKDDDLANDQERQTAKDVVNQLLDVADATIKAAKTDGGAVLLLKPGSLALAAGGFVAEGPQIAEALKKLAKLGQSKDPDFPVIHFDVETYRDVTLHTASIPLRTSQHQVRRVLGDPMSVIVGTGETSVYVAFGQDAMGLLKQVLDASEKSADVTLPPAELKLSLKPVLEFALSADDNPGLRAALAALQDYDGSDHISLRIVPIERGCKVRLQFEEGVLKAIGGAVKARNQASQY
jgi:hypothetical protein